MEVMKIKSTIITILKVILFINISVITYHLISKIYKRINKDIIEAQGIANKYSFKNFDKVFYRKNKYKNLYEKIESNLKKHGNPYNLTPVTYLGTKIGLSVLFFLASSFSKRNIIITIGISVLAYFAIDIIYYYRNKEDNKKILQDIPDICDVLEIQSYAGLDLGIALTEVYDITKCERLRDAFIKLSAEWTLTKDYEKVLDKFQENFNLPELDRFILAVKQSVKTGKCQDILNNQSEVLKQDNIFAIQEQTKKVNETLMKIGFLIFVGTALVVFFSFFMQITISTSKIFI